MLDIGFYRTAQIKLPFLQVPLMTGLSYRIFFLSQIKSLASMRLQSPYLFSWPRETSFASKRFYQEKSHVTYAPSTAWIFAQSKSKHYDQREAFLFLSSFGTRGFSGFQRNAFFPLPTCKPRGLNRLVPDYKHFLLHNANFSSLKDERMHHSCIIHLTDINDFFPSEYLTVTKHATVRIHLRFVIITNYL